MSMEPRTSPSPPPGRLVVTGATGWLGRTALALSRRWWGAEADACVAAFGSREGYAEVPGGGFRVAPLTEFATTDLAGATVLHLAFLTKDRLATADATDFIARNCEIDALVAASVRRSPPDGLFVASSGAARQVQRGANDLYGTMKLMQEQRFTALRADLAGVPVMIGRVWSVAGPFVNKPEAYALAAFLLQAARERRITIQATVPVYRSYLHVQDLIRVVLATLAARGRTPVDVIDLAGTETVEMADVAWEAARACGLKGDEVGRGPVDFTRRHVYVGDPTPFRDLALAAGLRPASFSRQVHDTSIFLGTGGL